jgi:hypothetical protein
MFPSILARRKHPAKGSELMMQFLLGTIGNEISIIDLMNLLYVQKLFLIIAAFNLNDK